nr:hypothetical protein [Tanacetum cinerariifolium]
MENSYCAVIQGLSSNAVIHAHADNDLPRPYATGKFTNIPVSSLKYFFAFTVSYSASRSMKGKRKLVK